MDLEKRIEQLEAGLQRMENKSRIAPRRSVFRSINFYLIAGLIAVAIVSAMSSLGGSLNDSFDNTSGNH
jgi:hypothetical protein